MTPRLDPLPAEGNPPEIQLLLDGAAGSTGGAANIFRTLAHHPGVLRRFLPFGGKLLFGGRLPARDRELLILRTAWNCGSDYEWGQHARIGRLAGLTDEEIIRVAAGPGEPAWDEADAELLRAADELLADHRLGEPSWTALAARFGPEELIEIILLVGNYAMLAGFLNTAGVEREPGVEGFPELG